MFFLIKWPDLIGQELVRRLAGRVLCVSGKRQACSADLTLFF